MKKLLLLVFSLAFGVVMLEAGAMAYYYLVQGESYDSKAQISKMQRVSGTDLQNVATQANKKKINAPTYILHPYTGYSGRPNVFSSVNEFGYRGSSPLTKTTEDQLLVGVAGGSVAAQLVRDAHDDLKAELERVYPGKEIVITGIALGGMKQPQQLMALNYLMVMGAQFDVVINLDGYNEGVLPIWENHRYGVAPMYPRAWNLYVQKALDIGRATLIGKLALLKQDQIDLAVLAQQPVLNQSVFVGLLWEQLHQYKQKQIFRLEGELATYKVDNKAAPQVTGPAVKYGDQSQLENFVLDIWQESSRQMLSLAKQNGFEYYHFLQPNQYVIGSKPLSQEEQQLLLPDEHKQTKLIRHMYQRLINRGQLLIGADIPYRDLTMMFKNNTETLYNDNCCHFNPRGYQLIAKEIANDIQAKRQSGVP